MDAQQLLAERFDAHRGRLRAVAYRMLGSIPEADDAVQEAWLRISRADASQVDNMGGWLTTVVARVCLNMLRARKSRREESLHLRVPEPLLDREDGLDPEHEALLGDSIGLALFVVLETLAPAERVAFVLHDIFDVPYDEIAPIVGRSSTAARQLASRARRRIRGVAPIPDRDLRKQRSVVDAFVAAVRLGEIEGLLAVLDPEVVLRADGGTRWSGGTRELRGALTVARSAVTITRLLTGFRVENALVNGAAGVVSWDENREPFSVMGFTVRNGKIVEIDVLVDPKRMHQLDLTAFDLPPGSPS
jgi:RNA polymerase sigma factor (sigma-70 family)